MKKINLIFGLFFGLPGLVMFIMAIFSFIDTINFNTNAIEVPALITEIDTYTDYDSDGERYTEHDVYISYSYEGKNYETELSEYSSTMKEGKTIQILIDPNCPNDARYSKMVWFMPFMFLLFGVIFGGVGGGFIVSVIKQMMTKSKAIRKGEEITAVITEVATQYNVTVNNVHPQYLICEYEDASGKYKFKSEPTMNLYDDLVGRNITVYFLNRKDYYVDIESLGDVF